MLPFAWASDVHLDHCSDVNALAFLKQVQTVDHLVVTGDISTASRLLQHLDDMRVMVPKLSFVLGNHDYYGSYVDKVQQATRLWATKHAPDVTYLDASAAVDLGDGAWLVGVDGYADGRAGDLFASTVWLNDYVFCKTFTGCTPARRTDLQRVLQQLAAESVTKLTSKLLDLFGERTPRAVYVATHAPPWDAAHWYNGNKGDMHWAPHFVNVALGREIEAWAKRHASTEFTVVCGHTHGPVRAAIAPNLTCLVAWSRYGQPVLQNPATLPSPAEIAAAPAAHVKYRP
jgi:predicted phosphodiesterase